MAIFELFEQEESFTETFDGAESSGEQEISGHLFSTLMTRGCFFLLLLGSIAWIVYSALLLTISSAGFLLSAGKMALFRRGITKFWLHLRRLVICILSLFIGLFSPSFGIMVACTYFLMYDKAGMEEIIPSAFQAQMKDIFQSDL